MTLKKPLASLVLEAAANDKPLSEEPSPLPDLGIDLEEHKLFYQVQALEQELLESKDTHNLRLDYSNKIFWLVCSWLICVAVSIFLSGFKIGNFSLSDKVLITFITSTTINVVGLFIVVAKWMFPSNNNNNKKRKS